MTICPPWLIPKTAPPLKSEFRSLPTLADFLQLSLSYLLCTYSLSLPVITLPSIHTVLFSFLSFLLLRKPWFAPLAALPPASETLFHPLYPLSQWSRMNGSVWRTVLGETWTSHFGEDAVWSRHYRIGAQMTCGRENVKFLKGYNSPQVK